MARGVRVRVAVCTVRDGRILLVQHEKEGRRYWLLPGGGLEVGETLQQAAAREAVEETGYAMSVGRLLLICEVIVPGGRHILNLVYRAEVTGGDLRCGDDAILCDVRWIDRAELHGLELRPPIGGQIEAAWAADFEGDVRVLGDVWRPDTAGNGPGR